MQTFLEKLFPTHPYEPVSQDDEDVPETQVEVLPASWYADARAVLATTEAPIKKLRAEYTRWTLFSTAVGATLFNTPSSIFGLLWGLNSYISYPITHTPILLKLYEQLNNATSVFSPVKEAYENSRQRLFTGFWNMLVQQGSQQVSWRGSNRKYFLSNNCFWDQGYPLYEPNFPVEFKPGYLSNGAPKVYLNGQILNTEEHGILCQYFWSNHSLSLKNRTPSFEYCQSNLNTMCTYLTELKQITPEYESLSKEIQLIENDINDNGGNYQFIPSFIFWGILVPVTVCATGCFVFLSYAIYKDRQAFKTKLDTMRIEADSPEATKIHDILTHLNTMLPKEPITLENETVPSLCNKLENRLNRMEGYFHFFKCAKEALHKDVTPLIIRTLFPAITNTPGK